MVDTSRVDAALQRSQDHLLGLQAPAGFWLGELEADTTITSEYLLLRHLLGTPDRDLERRALPYLRDRQGSDGSWNLYEAGAGDLSATIKAYFAMKVAGVGVDDPAMARAAVVPTDSGHDARDQPPEPERLEVGVPGRHGGLDPVQVGGEVDGRTYGRFSHSASSPP